jgi:hypothetical protein
VKIRRKDRLKKSSIVEYPATRIDKFFNKMAKFRLLFKLEEFCFRKSFNILAIRGPTMLASMSKVAQIIDLSYEWDFWALLAVPSLMGP